MGIFKAFSAAFFGFFFSLHNFGSDFVVFFFLDFFGSRFVIAVDGTKCGSRLGPFVCPPSLQPADLTWMPEPPRALFCTRCGQEVV